ncbi:hypothetical protein V9T40_003191 [Parthenolecanium corni]|uniref:Uncharacterized protein n=1 Tax=Parthenolecanium corni TaxID=536013 RepID=A0AAN9TSP7_9HEMI
MCLPQAQGCKVQTNSQSDSQLDSRTDLSLLSEPASQIPVDDTIIPRDQHSMDEIFEKMCEEIREVCEDIKKECRTKHRSATPSAVAEKTVVMQEMSTLLENKRSIVNKLAAHVKESKFDDFSHFKGEATISIPCMMEEEVDSCQKAVALLEKMREENSKELEVLKECEKISREMDETEVEPEMTESLLHKINAEIIKEFKQCKRDMKMVVETLYPDSNCMEILGELVEKSVENGSSEWYEISDPSQLPVILLLSSLGLIKINSDNDQLVQLNL